MKFKHEAKAGTLILVDQGEYSNYVVMGFFVALRDFTPANEIELFLQENPAQKEDYKFDQDLFLAYLIGKGLLLEIQYGNLYMGSYRSGEANFTPPGDA